MRETRASLDCKIDGCSRKAMYREQQVCQKHYFRFMRTGGYEDRPLSRGTRRQDPRGYWQIYEPEHPLADRTGHVWEHRKIVYARYGDTLPPCELCDKPVSWKTVHIDHEDENRANNDPKNLRPLCRVCNTTRTIPHNAVLLTIGGVTQNAEKWARDSRCTVNSATIRQRLGKGWTHERCVFDPPAHRGRPKGSGLKKVMNKKARRLEKRIEQRQLEAA